MPDVTLTRAPLERRRFGQTARHDARWLQPLQREHYESGPYRSPI